MTWVDTSPDREAHPASTCRGARAGREEPRGRCRQCGKCKASATFAAVGQVVRDRQSVLVGEHAATG